MARHQTWHRALLLAVALAATTLLASACGGSGGTPAPTPPVISSFAAPTASVPAGTPATLTWSVSGADSVKLVRGSEKTALEVSARATGWTVIPWWTQTYRLEATNAAGTTSAEATVTVTAAPASLEAACSGAGCGADGSRYAGTGIGIWRYKNTTGETQTVPVSIELGGAARTRKALLLFANAAEEQTALPDAGQPPVPPVAIQASATEARPDPGSEGLRPVHVSMADRNRALAIALAGKAARPGEERLVAPPLAAPTPAIGEERTWNDTASDPDRLPVPPPAAVTFLARVADTCELTPGGRTAIFWVDKKVTMTAADLAYYKGSFCGAGKGYDRVVGLRGEPWGLDPKPPATEYIQDTASARLPVDVVFYDSAKSLGGYFHSVNNCLKTADPDCAHSNERLAFFVNMDQVVSRSDAASTLVHELTHMVNFYQRSIGKGWGYETWLEEMSAEMTEDMVTPKVTEDTYWAIGTWRLQPYIRAGGAIDFTKWGNNAAVNPYQGVSSLGAFLNRRYGLAIYQKMRDCSTSATAVACVDGLVRAEGGAGFSDEFARMGATVYGFLAPGASPAGYGYPAKDLGGLTAQAVDLSGDLYRNCWRANPAPVGTAFGATTQTYEFDSIAAEATTYSRPTVKVPAGATLMVVIQ